MKKKKILIVEGEKTVALQLRAILNALGYSVCCEVSSGKQAIASIRKNIPDCILMDVSLKGEMSGIEAATVIMDRFDIPVIFLAAPSDSKLLEQAKYAGTYGYILKPFDESDIRIGIAMVLQKHSTGSQLRTERQWFEIALQSAGDAMIATDKKGLVTLMNSVAEKLTGWKQKQALGKKLGDIFNVEDIQTGKRRADITAKVLRQRTTVSLTHRTILIAKDGTRRCIDDSAAPVINGAEEITGIVITFRDGTEKRKLQDELVEKNSGAEEKLNHLNKRLNLITRVTSEVIGTLPIQTQAREMIEQVKQAFGVDTVIIRVTEDDTLHLLASTGVDEQLLEKTIPSNYGISKQMKASRRALTIKNIRENISDFFLSEPPVTDPAKFDFISYAGAPLLIGHTFIGLIGLYSRKLVREFSATDLEQLQIVANHISVAIANARMFKEIREQNIEMVKHIEEQTRAEKLLRDSEERYRGLVEHSPTAIFVHVNGEIQFVNQAAVMLFGASAAAGLIGRKVADLIHPDYRADAEQQMMKVYENYILPAAEQKYLRLDGAAIDVEISSIPFTFEGRPAAQVIARNITDRKQHEVALLESELRFRSLFENAKDAVFLADTKTGIIIDMNVEAEKLLKRSRREIIGQHRSFIHPPDRSAEADTLFREQILTLGEHPVEFEVIDAAGKRIPVEIKASMIRLDDNRIISQGIFRDISERKIAEESLRESEHRFRTLAENLPGVVYLCKNDERFTMLYLNDQVKQLTGYSKDEFLEDRVSFVDLYHPDDVADIIAKVDAALSKHNPFHIVYRIKHLNGSWRWIEEQGIGVYRGGTLLRLEGFLSDITDRKIAESALQESEEKYRRLFEDSKDGIYITTIEGMMLDVNSSMMEILGFQEKEELKKYNVKDLYFYPADRERLLKEFELQDYVKDFEVTLKKKDSGKAHVLLTTVVIRNDQGKPILLNGSMRDITEKKQLEQQLIQAQKMESIGTLAGGIAHDFNNLLAMILGTAELIKRHVKENPAIQSYVNRIIEASERGSSISKQLLLFARPEQTELRPVSVRTVAEHVTDFLLHFLPKTIIVRCEFADVSAVIMGDEGHLHQAILNLSINARDAMPGGGIITIGVKNVDVHTVRQQFPEAAEHEYVAVTVHDTGVGMEEEIQQRIFEPFFSTKTRGKGTGLGLAIVHGIVQLHQGFINVHSTKGIGTTFTMYFPSITADAAETNQQESAARKENNETILIVDDEQILREILRESLKDEGYNILAASDGVEALKLYAEYKDTISLVVTDLGMPNMGGEELFGKLQAMNNSVKVIISSGFFEGSTRSNLLLRGVKDVLTKPYRFDVIFSTVRKVIDNE